MWHELIQWLEKIQHPCTFKKYMGFPCPGCGFQSAFIELLKGNLWESIQLYPALLPIIGTIISFFIQLKVNSKTGSVIVKTLFFLSIFLILGNYFKHFIA
ncbi:DUF2752 domain-containing protein [Marinifilum caeruleilacunae]|uniref:DUF2752 domain-containing protein n=1 Tax=Marinifilum caeruleilacunae TaxID=2499076 RepID=A0ABX1WYK1_9BACT|nr:DUF2752 domain-containing protein [Marinifilum caeruleilacunae]